MLAPPLLLAQVIVRLDMALPIDFYVPPRGALWSSESALVPRVVESKRNSPSRRQHPAKLPNEVDHFLLVSVREHRKSQNDIEPHPKIGDRQVAHAALM